MCEPLGLLLCPLGFTLWGYFCPPGWRAPCGGPRKPSQASAPCSFPSTCPADPGLGIPLFYPPWPAFPGSSLVSITTPCCWHPEPEGHCCLHFVQVLAVLVPVNPVAVTLSSLEAEMPLTLPPLNPLLDGISYV